MRASLLICHGRKVQILEGIPALIGSYSNELVLFSLTEHLLSMNYLDVATMPPLRRNGDSGTYRILSASLHEAASSEIFLMKEGQPSAERLLFVDPFDMEGQEGSGFFTLPPSHAPGLPSRSVEKPNGKVLLGLTRLVPGESFLLKTTAGACLRIGLSPLGEYHTAPCTGEDLALLGIERVSVPGTRPRKPARMES